MSCDGVSAYSTPQQQHQRVNHSISFVDPDNDDIHTNTCEGMWGNFKDKFRRMHGTSDALFDSYFKKFMFHNRLFMHIIYWIAHYFPIPI